ncbi:MAG: capsule biosynthesis protein [Gammaproteobacteria bacterium]
MLQSPMGPFFRRLASDLRWAGAQVCKINFNGGDVLFYPTDAVNYTGDLREWAGFLQRFVRERRIDLILLFGDCRPVHRVARQVAESMGLELGVFEEGYIRPHYVTLERHGVNANSHISRSPLFYLNRPTEEAQPAQRVEGAFWSTALWAILYYLAAAVMRPVFSRYTHHRSLSLTEAFPWLKSFFLKSVYALRERRIWQRLNGELAGRFFLVPLQVHNDSQIHTHSSFDTVEHFIECVVRSFAGNAAPDTQLVIKHHPMDRGYHDYTRYIRRLSREYRVEGRVHYVHDLHLPTLLRNAVGVVLVNSTVGLSALFHGRPLKVCGAAIYDMPGLTFRGSLKDFWQGAAGFTMDRGLYQRFRAYLIQHTQLNGNLYKRLEIPGSSAGLVWPPAPAVDIPAVGAPERVAKRG